MLYGEAVVLWLEDECLHVNIRGIKHVTFLTEEELRRAFMELWDKFC